MNTAQYTLLRKFEDWEAKGKEFTEREEEKARKEEAEMRRERERDSGRIELR